MGTWFFFFGIVLPLSTVCQFRLSFFPTQLDDKVQSDFVHENSFEDTRLHNSGAFIAFLV